jgi:hypothetical protein
MTYDRALKRVYVFGARIHHGAVGLALSVIGLALVIHDRADWPFRFRDQRRGAQRISRHRSRRRVGRGSPWI